MAEMIILRVISIIILFDILYVMSVIKKKCRRYIKRR